MIHPSAHTGVEEGEVGHEAVVGKDSVSPQRLTGSVYKQGELCEEQMHAQAQETQADDGRLQVSKEEHSTS